MEKNTFAKFLMILLLFLLASCQTSEPVNKNPDYASGKQLAEEYAKKDAKKLGCMLYRRNAWRNIMSGNLSKHTTALENEKTKDFLNGFIEGYRKYYAEYADMYCGK